MKELSRITNLFEESVIREMTRICDAVNGINLSQGFPDFNAPEALKEAAKRAIDNEFNQYPVTFGEPELREAISKKAKSYNGISCNPDTDITVTCGATEAMMAALKAVINPGDEIIIFEPFYENYGPDCILSGATPKYITLHYPEWNYDSDKLAALFNEKTKAIIINTPNNPTGKIFSKEEMEEIAGLCIKHDVIAITDEIYEHILYDGNKHLSIASLPGMEDRTITINSVSKTYSVTGWRVGWAIACEEITSRIRKVHDFLTVGAPTPLQHGAAEALAFDDSYYKGLADHYYHSRGILDGILSKAGFKYALPAGSYYIFADVADLRKKLNAKDDTEFSRKLIEITGVATIPGSAFYSNPEEGIDQVRFTYCKKTETLNEVAEKMKALHKYL